jgi:chromosome partitioning protein
MRNLLKAGLRRLASAHPETVSAPPRHLPGQRKATVIAVAARKGGVGKTTSSVSLAAALARYHGHRVLLVDLDPQGHVHTALKAAVADRGWDGNGVVATEGPVRTLSAVITDERHGELLDAIVATDVPDLWVTPYDPHLATTEDLLGTRIGKEYVLRDAIRLARTHFDTIVVDCPPNLGNLTVNGLVAADQVMIPCDPSPLALKGVDSLVDAIETIAARLNPSVDVLGVLLTRVDGRNLTVNEAIIREIEHAYGPALLPTRIGVSTSLSKAQMVGRDIFAFDADCRGAAQYRELAAHVVASR